MITILGSEMGPEVDAAKTVRDAIVTAWPWAETNPAASIFLVPNVQCYGETPQDLDLVVLLTVPPDKAKFTPFTPLRVGMSDKPEDISDVRVRSLCLVIEVKDHGPQNVRFEGMKVEVRYPSSARSAEWHSATKQSESQKYSLKRYLERHMPHPVPWITNLLWLRNVAREALPKGTHNILPATVTWSGILNVVAINMGVWDQAGIYTLSAAKAEKAVSFARVCDLLTHRLVPTTLDRHRMDCIAKAEIQNNWMDSLGKQQLIFAGRGGTGKTMILLGLAWRAQEQRGARCLVLTYNRALVADIRRLLTLMGASDEIGGPCIQVHTIHSFFYRLFKALGVMDEADEDFLKDFENNKTIALDYVRNQLLTRADLAKAAAKAPELLLWDLVFIDEAQDWPTDERDILHALYSAIKFVIADGRDQLVRADANCDWSKGDFSAKSLRIQLNRGLRMKSNLARFANALAETMKLSGWNIEEHRPAAGGRIIVVEGDYFNSRERHDFLVNEAAVNGNYPVDLLLCVPPALVAHDNAGHRYAKPATTLRAWGHEVWDAVSEEQRSTYPTSVRQLRIVQYDSCRGLEGWTVINLGLDEFFEYKLASWAQTAGVHSQELVDEPLLAQRHATRWLMIPVSRAIDTLVLQVHSRQTAVGAALHDIAQRFGDFVEWVSV